MNQLSVVELSRGAYYPNGGIYSIPKALEKLAIDLGVSIENKLMLFVFLKIQTNGM